MCRRIQPANTSRTRIRVVVRNTAVAAVAAGLTTQVEAVTPADAVAVGIVVPVARIMRPTCRAAMPREPTRHVPMRRARVRSPLRDRTVAVIADGMVVPVAAVVRADVEAVTAESLAAIAVVSHAVRVPVEAAAAARAVASLVADSQAVALRG